MSNAHRVWTTVITAIALFSIPTTFVVATGESEEPASVRVTPIEESSYVDNIFATRAEYENATGTAIDVLHEPPMLANLVASGEIPPIDARVPIDAQVVRPAIAIGVSGGTLNDAGIAPRSGRLVAGSQQPLAKWPPSWSEARFVPNVPKKWTVSPDGRMFTLELRRGMRWSDGELLTTIDFEFFYFDILKNQALTPMIPSRYRPGSELMTMKVIDDYIVQYEFAEPYHRVIPAWAGIRIFAPKHYLSRYHSKYNPDADDLAKQEGYDTWTDAFNSHWTGDVSWLESSQEERHKDQPTTDVFVLKEHDAIAGVQIYERNPYYWKLDSIGNQLPYVDRVRHLLMNDPERLLVLVGNGEIDWPDFRLFDTRDQYTAILSDTYRVLAWDDLSSSTPLAVALNYTHNDTIKREIFYDVRFRRALSWAIDRTKMSDLLFDGIVAPFTPPVHSHWTGFDDSMAWTYSEHNVDGANALLDEMGLTDRDAEGWRLMGDGSRLTIDGVYYQTVGKIHDAIELVAEDWRHIGVQLKPRWMDVAAWRELSISGDLDATLANTSGGAEILARMYYPGRLIPPWHWYPRYPTSSYPWGVWYHEGPDYYDDPPAEIKRLFELTGQFLGAAIASDEYNRVAKELIKQNVDMLYNFGTVSTPPLTVVVTERIGNVPEYSTILLGDLQPFNVDTFYIQE